MHSFLKFILEMKLYMFQTVPLAIISSYSLYTQQRYMSYRFVDSFRACRHGTAVPSWSCSHAVYKPLWNIPLLSVQWITPGDGQRNCLKHVQFHFQNKFEKRVHLVGFIIRKFVTMHGHMNVKFVVYCVQYLYDNGKVLVNAGAITHVQTLWRVCYYSPLQAVENHHEIQVFTEAEHCLPYDLPDVVMFRHMVAVLQHIPAWCRLISLLQVANECGE
jgi:hypothetical protein